MKKQQTVFVAARITEAQQAIVLETAQRMPGAVTGNFSAALRYIIDDWARMSEADKEQTAKYGDADLARHNQIEGTEARIKELEGLLDAQGVGAPA